MDKFQSQLEEKMKDDEDFLSFSIRTPVSSKKYRDNFDRIFRKTDRRTESPELK